MRRSRIRIGSGTYATSSAGRLTVARYLGQSSKTNADQSVRGRERTASKQFEDDARVEGGAALDVEVGLQEGCREPVDPLRARDGRAVSESCRPRTGGCPRSGRPRRDPSARPGAGPAWWTLSSEALIAASNSVGNLASRQEIVEQLQRLAGLAGRGRVERLPDRLHPAGTTILAISPRSIRLRVPA